MSLSTDCTTRFQEHIQDALATRTPLLITGSGSKRFLGRLPENISPLDTRTHTGIVEYDPSELVVTVRSGTPIAELEAALAEQGQMLPCESPHFGPEATVGGLVGTGLSGPRRPWAGSVRDFVLGCRIISGQGKALRFGGQVMKNVAGYDISRLMVGSFGCLGLITEVSFKVLPCPRSTRTLALELSQSEARSQLAAWGQQPLPISAACHDGQQLYLRLEGGEGSVKAARESLGGTEVSGSFWATLREQKHDFFRDLRPLWRLSVSPVALLPELPGDSLLDWGGALYWLKSDADPASLRALAEAAGGHADCWTPGVTDAPLHPLPAGLMQLHQQIKRSLDPAGVFNPGRCYPGL